MPHHPTKKQRLEDGHAAAASADSSDYAVSLGDLSVDVLADIFGFLDGPKDIMCKRRVCKKWREAVKKTIVPPTEFCVNSLVKCNAMNVMTRAMPNLQQIKISYLGWRHKYIDGEDPDEEQATVTADDTTHDIEIISNFSNLRILEIDTLLNGRYSFLFNSFPLLQKMRITGCNKYLKWDLEMLAGFPLLKELMCAGAKHLTGNINSLRVLKDTLEKVNIGCCDNVVGNFLDLADFPHLKKLDLCYTAVTGDIRDIGGNDFSTLEHLKLPKGVYGGKGYELQSISDGPDLMRTLYLFGKQRPALHKMKDFCGNKLYWQLSQDSPDWYDWVDGVSNETTPFNIQFVQAGSRLGYQWYANELGSCASLRGNTCEVNWLDPEPDKESSDYAKYLEELQVINRHVNIYRGFHQPPTEEEYYGLLEEYADESDEFDDELANEILLRIREEWRHQN